MASFSKLIGTVLPPTLEEFQKKFGGEKRATAVEELYDTLNNRGDAESKAAVRAMDASDDLSYPSMAQSLADAVYGDGTAPASGIRGKDATAEPELIERNDSVDESGEVLAGEPKKPDAKPAPSADGPKATPKAMELAKEYGIDLATLTGTGKGGQIIPKDVYTARKAADATPKADATPQPAKETQQSLPMGESADSPPAATPRVEDAAPVQDSRGALFAGAGPYGEGFSMDTGIPGGVGGMQMGTDMASLSAADPMNLGLMDLLLGSSQKSPVVGSTPSMSTESFDTGMPMPSAAAPPTQPPFDFSKLDMSAFTMPPASTRSADPLANLTDSDFDNGRYEPAGVINAAQPQAQSSFFPQGYSPYTAPPPPPVDISQLDWSSFQTPDTPTPVDFSQIDMSAFQMPDAPPPPPSGPPPKWTGVTDTTLNMFKRMGLNTEPGGLFSEANVKPVTGYGDAYLRNGLWTIPATAAGLYAYNSTTPSPYATTAEQQQQASDRLKQAEQKLQGIKGAPRPIATPNWNQ
jgi:hypothetical protein